MGLKTLAAAAAILAAPAFTSPAQSQAVQTLSGTFGSDDQVDLFDIVLTSQSDLNVFTTSYGGGTNLDGSVTPAGGFVPIISLFAPDGTFIVDDGADIGAPGNVDPATGISDDAMLSALGLAPGTYTLALSEFPNFPNGNLSDGFFAASLANPAGNFTGDLCSQPGGSFIQTDLVSCPQRTNAFTVNIAAAPAVPEPSTYALMLVAFGGLGLTLRRKRSLAGASRALRLA